MQHTLINPIQLRHFNLIVKDNPYSTDEPMRTEVEDGELVMTLQSDGTVIYLYTWTTTDDDLCSLPHVTMSFPHPWNPCNVHFPKTSCRVQEEF